MDFAQNIGPTWQKMKTNILRSIFCISREAFNLWMGKLNAKIWTNFHTFGGFWPFNPYFKRYLAEICTKYAIWWYLYWINLVVIFGQKWRACPYLGIDFCSWLSHFWSNWTEFFVRAQETIIYRLVMQNISYHAYFSIFIFWCHRVWDIKPDQSNKLAR